MTTILTECANKIVEKLLNLILGETYYVCCFKCIVEDFEKEKEELNAKWMTVGKEVENAKRRADNIREDVTHWRGQAENLVKEDTRTRKTCFLGWCPNCIWRYHRGKELALKMEDIRRLKGSNFENVGRPPNLPGVEYHSSQGYIHFESRDLRYKELLAALEDDNNYMTGFQGMGGTGKTTMAIEVGKKLQESKKFDHVIFTVVSNAPDIKKIQDGIAGPLGLSLKDKSEWERPKILWNRLTDGQKILIILDDVWEFIDFQEIGIPLSDNHKGCRVLLTTRNVRVCSLMGCQRTIQLGLLSEKDAWKLFKEHAGISDNSSKNLQKKGQEIAKECKGLPVAIAAIASTLKGQRHLEEWKAALTALRNSKPVHGVDESLIETYKCLRYSYDYMKCKKAQELFLLCSVFQEDEEVLPEILTRFAIGVGLFDEVDKYDEARNQVHVAKNKLVDSCLLLEDEEGCVKMHDLVREVALWIANNEIQVVTLSDKNQKALAEKEKNIKYLLCDGRDMDVFSNWFDGTKLEILLVRIDADDSVNVPNAFFEKMTRLRVLYLYYNDWPRVVLSLPQSILSLTNIRSLFLEDWKLGDISILGNLRSLETLDLVGCSISELPNEITELEKLRLLKLNDCKIKRNNPFEVIEKCSPLEELYFEGNEISQLDNVNEAEAIHHNRTSLALQKYRLTGYRGRFNSMSKCVALPKIDALISEATFKYLARTAEILELERIKGEWRNLIPEIVPMEAEAVNDLVELGLDSCSKVHCLVDTKHISSCVQNVFSKLVELKLTNMDNLEEPCSGSFPLDFLKSLERLLIRNCAHLGSMLFKSKLNLCNVKIMELGGCPMLTSIFKWSTARSLVLLEKLSIRRCEQLTNIIITDERSGDENREEIVDGDNDHKRSDGDPMFPKLKTLEIETCNRLEFILPVLFAQDVPLLEAIKIDGCGELKYIFGQYQREDQELHQAVKNVVLGSLKEIALQRLPNFIDIFPECYHPMSLSCSRAVSMPKHSDPSNHNIFPCSHICCYAHKYRPKLRSATSTNIPMISKVGQPDDSISSTLNSDCRLHPFGSAQCISKSKLSLILLLRNIREVNLKDLPKIKSLFTMSIAQTMLVEILRIEECDGVKNIVAEMGDDHESKNYGSIFPKLRVLSVSNCDQLEYMLGLGTMNNLDFHIDLPALEELTLRSLPNIINICPRNYRVIVPPLKVFNFDGCPQFPIKSINGFLVSLDSRQLDGTTPKDLRGIVKHLLTLENLYVGKSKVECIFSLDELQITQQINLGLQYLKLDNLSQMTYICIGLENSFTLQNLKELQIVGCEKLEVIFPASIKRWLPQLVTLEIRECKELKQIIEEDLENQKLSNLLSAQPCFPELKALIVKQCNELKRFIPVSVSNELPKLELLIVKEALKLEEVFGFDKTGELKIELPKLKLVMFIQLPSLCQGIELQTVRHRVVHNCPKLSLSSTAHTSMELRKNLEDSKEYRIGGFYSYKLVNMLDELTQETSNQNPTMETTSEFQVGPKVEATPGTEFPSSQVNTNQSMQANLAECTQNDNGIEPLKTKTKQTPDPKFSPIASPNLKESNEESESVGKVAGSEISAIATSTDSELVGRTSPSPLDTALHKTHTHELVDEQSMGEPFLMKQQQPIGETEINIQSRQGNKSLKETEDQSIQEGSKSEKTVTATLSTGTDSETRDSSVGPLPASRQKSVKRRIEEGITSSSIHSEQASSPSGPLVTSQRKTYPRRNEEPEKEFVGKIPISEIPAIATSPTDSELVERSYPSPLDIPLHKTHSHEMLDGQSIGEPKPLGETESSIEFPQCIKRGVEEGTTTENAKIVTSSTLSEPTSSLPGPLVTSQHNTCPHREIKLSQTETYSDKENEGDPINIQDFGDDDLISLIQPVEEDGDDQIPTPSVSDSVVAAEHSGTKDDLVMKVLADLEVSLKMPLKDIACSEANSLRLLTALNFLSGLPLEDVALSDGLKAIIHSLHQHFPSILCSFKQAFATTNKFAVLAEKEKSIKEELAQRNEAAITLVSKISKAKKFMDEAQQKEAILKEQIHRLEKEIKACEAKLSSLEEEKKKCVAETIGCKKEFEGVRKDKSQMVEDQRKARHELFEVDYTWSTLCSQFEHNRIAARNLS